MAPATASTILLRHGPLSCVVSPALGGGIVRFTLNRQGELLELMRPAPATPAGPLDLACFPLVPFSNRIAGGRFRFDSHDVMLPANMGGCPHPIHGHGWQVAWTVEAHGSNWLRMAYRHAVDSWPWPYRAVQTMGLTADQLSVSLELVNEGPEPQPAGIGLHPYFPKPPGTVLTADVAAVWLTDEAVLPTRHMPLPEAWKLPQGIVMDKVVLDHGFTGWKRQAVIDWTALRTRLSVVAEGPFGHLVIYAPHDGDFFCVEPVTHMTDAVNHAAAGETDTGMTVLAPGESLTGTVTFTVSARE